MCPTCSSGVPLPELAHLRWPLCEKCYFGRLARSRLGGSDKGPAIKRKLEDQSYRCAYSGIQLVLGSNATLDHILPVSSHPELRNDLDNIEWVDKHVNEMKWSMTPDEFRDLLVGILGHRWGLRVR